MSEPRPVSEDSSADSAPESSDQSDSSGLLTPEVLRTVSFCASGCMFIGMAIWIILLDPTPREKWPTWPGWRGRDALVSLAAAYFLRGMAQSVWPIVLYQREQAGGSPLPALTRNLGHVAWQILALVASVSVFALAPYHLGARALGFVPASAGWLAAGATLGVLGGPVLVLLAILLRHFTNDRTWLEGSQLDFLFPRAGGQVPGRLAIAGMLVSSVVLAPCAEEALFRGVVFSGLRNDLGTWVALPLSSAIFGLFHREYGAMSVVFASLVGAICAILFEASGSLWPAVVMHVLVNSKVIVFCHRTRRN